MSKTVKRKIKYKAASIGGTFVPEEINIEINLKLNTVYLAAFEQQKVINSIRDKVWELLKSVGYSNHVIKTLK